VQSSTGLAFALVTVDDDRPAPADLADEALAALEEQKPDLVVLDFNMPGRDGLDLAAQLRRIRPTMPVAVISANHQQEIIDRANAAGATFLSKPLTEPALRDFIEGAERQIRAARHE